MDTTVLRINLREIICFLSQTNITAYITQHKCPAKGSKRGLPRKFLDHQRLLSIYYQYLRKKRGKVECSHLKDNPITKNVVLHGIPNQCLIQRKRAGSRYLSNALPALRPAIQHPIYDASKRYDTLHFLQIQDCQAL